MKHKLFVHVCYNQIEAAYETVRIQEKRNKIATDLRWGLEEKVLREEPGFLKKYFIRHEDGSYTFNNAAFMQITNKAGLLVLVSDSVKNAEQAYQGSVPELLQDADGIKEVIFADGYHSVSPITKTKPKESDCRCLDCRLLLADMKLEQSLPTWLDMQENRMASKLKPDFK